MGPKVENAICLYRGDQFFKFFGFFVCIGDPKPKFRVEKIDFVYLKFPDLMGFGQR
jgi:hypothetical protein